MVFFIMVLLSISAHRRGRPNYQRERSGRVPRQNGDGTGTHAKIAALAPDLILRLSNGRNSDPEPSQGR
jgi:hypothetical protein